MIVFRISTTCIDLECKAWDNPANSKPSIQGWEIHFPKRRGKPQPGECNIRLHAHLLQREADRLDLQHHVLCLTFNSKLYFSPLDSPRHALDVGTGTGIWAIDFGLSSMHYLLTAAC